MATQSQVRELKESTRQGQAGKLSSIYLMREFNGIGITKGKNGYALSITFEKSPRFLNILPLIWFFPKKYHGIEIKYKVIGKISLC